LSAARPEHASPWERFYGLAAPPFSLTADPRFVFPSRSHSRAFDEVTAALRRREGLIVVTGDIGTGKTVLCRTLLDTFEPRTFLSVILDPRLSADDLLQQVLADFGLMRPPEPDTARPEIDRHQLVATLQRFLATLIPVNAHAVIMIDEAQHLDPAVLEEIRLLSNFEAADAKLLQIVLVGQRDLDALLRRPDMQQVAQRIARRVTLHPLSADEVRQYVERRLAVAAGRQSQSAEAAAVNGVRFTPAAIEALARLSAGIPRIVNTVANHALEIGYAERATTIDEHMVAAAADRLKLEPPASPVPSTAPQKSPSPPMAATVPIEAASTELSAPASPDVAVESTLPDFASLDASEPPAPLFESVPAAWVPPADIATRRSRLPLAAAAAVIVLVGGAAWWWWSQPGTPTQSVAPRTATPSTGRSTPSPAQPAPAAQTPPSPPSTTASTKPTTAGEDRSSAAAGAAAPRRDTGAAAAAAPGAGVAYEISVAAFRTSQRAEEVADAIGQTGLPVATRSDPTGSWHLIVVGPLGSTEEAEVAQRVLARQGFAGTRLSQIARPNR